MLHLSALPAASSFLVKIIEPTLKILSRQRRYTSRLRRGCLDVPAQEERCPDDGPECQSCVRLSLECVWDARRQVISTKEVASAQLASTCAPSCVRDAYAADASPSVSIGVTPSAMHHILVPQSRRCSSCTTCTHLSPISPFPHSHQSLCQYLYFCGIRV